jgi:hypothetical protein
MRTQHSCVRRLFTALKNYAILPLRLTVANIVILSLILVMIEGLASYVLLVHNIMTTPSIAERRHTKYDSKLGWVNELNVYIPDMYGPGVYFKTNSQGFRNNQDFDIAVPKGKYRIICSGDSFTLGYGVDNDHTWCQLLTSLDPGLQTLNMGQGGYGVDQAYLWYKRDATKFEYQAHLLAFITADFYRMQSDRFLGYGKPVLDIENGTLVVRNVPVPGRAYDLSWLIFNSPNLRWLRTVQLLTRGLSKTGFMPEPTSRLSKKEISKKTRAVVREIFEDLQRLNEARSSKFILVYLPTGDELQGNRSQEAVKFIEAESHALGVPLINVLSTFQSLPYENAVSMFIPKGQVKYLAAGHLNEQGNEFVARVVYEKLKEYLVIPPGALTTSGKLKASLEILDCQEKPMPDSNELFSPNCYGR